MKDSNQQKHKLTFIDLFAGLGGFNFALSELGFECVFASELKEDLRTLYTINFPGIEIRGDITQIDPMSVPAHDILCAGFPCQPFSQAGKRQGFEDEKDRGNLFFWIVKILNAKKPKYIILENVANLENHDEGNTWNRISEELDEAGYWIDKRILSPHQFGIPQHRKRIYIIGIDKNKGSREDLRYPNPTNRPCDIRTIINIKDKDIIPIKPETREQLRIWEEFLRRTYENDGALPSFPIWAMEFGANYDFEELAPAYQSLEQLQGKRGNMGRLIDGETLEECLEELPVYALTDKTKTFPKWKISYIKQNREFYERNKEWLDVWLQQVQDYENSHLKIEWNCGADTEPSLYDKIIQYRASGIRIKLPTYSPALNLVGTQIPIFPWVPLSDEPDENGQILYGRYMTVKEAAKLQGMRKLKTGNKRKRFQMSNARLYEALGNAVNVDIVKKIAEAFIK